MASPIQKVPATLLPALDLKTLGRNPNALSDTVVPTLELLDMYLAPALGIADTVGLMQNNGQVITRDVASGQALVVYGAGGDIAITLGETSPDGIAASVLIERGGTTMPIASGPPEAPQAFAAAGTYAFFQSFTRPLIALGGTRFHLRLERTLSANSSCRLLLLVAPLQV